MENGSNTELVYVVHAARVHDHRFNARSPACATKMPRKFNAMRSNVLVAAVLSVLLCDWLATGAAGQMRPAVSATAAGSPAASTSTSSSAPTTKLADRRDALLMLDGGPIHVRMHLALGGVSLVEARRQYVSR